MWAGSTTTVQREVREYDHDCPWRGCGRNRDGVVSEQDGHTVEVVERQSEAALETSWGNGGVIHASEVEPWSQPGMPLKILKWLGQENAPLLLRYGAIPHMWRWGLEFAATARLSASVRMRRPIYRSRSIPCDRSKRSARKRVFHTIVPLMA